jgi:putative ABC transport system permease protein
VPWQIEYIEADRVIETVYTGMVCPRELDESIRAVLALAAGWWSLRAVLRQPVLQTLRRAGAV